jgi:hypothetical protein
MVVQAVAVAQAVAAEGSLTGITPNGDTLRVREVWEDNLDDEMAVRPPPARRARRRSAK